MDSSALEICTCGSGLPFEHCHGDPANEFARETALDEARAIAALFPVVRVRGEEVEQFLDAVATELHEDEEPDEELLARGLTMVEDAERRRAAESWTEPYADRWASLAHAAGDEGAAEAALLLGALEVGVAERRPTPRDLLSALESGAAGSAPAALALAIPPMFVWSRDEAGAGVAAARGRRGAAERIGAAEQVAWALMSFEHVRRTRRLAARVAAELPLDGFPRASGFLGDVCRGVDIDLEEARGVAAALLIAYVEQLRKA